jgi:hypothetical protein
MSVILNLCRGLCERRSSSFCVKGLAGLTRFSRVVPKFRMRLLGLEMQAVLVWSGNSSSVV